MKKNKEFSRRSIPLALLLFFVAGSFVFKSPGYAEEAVLNSFQNEIVMAKEKRMTYSDKLDWVNQAMESEKSRHLHEEAEALIKELTRDGYSSMQVEPKLSTQPQEVKLVPSIQAKPAPTKKAPARRKFGFRYKVDDQLSAGESLYKVAVSDNKIDLKEMIEIGLANNLFIEAAKKKIEVAESKLVEAKRAMYPTLQAVTEEIKGHAPSGGSTRFFRGRNYKVNANQPLFYGGELVLTVKQAEENVLSAKADYEKTKNEFIHQIRTSFYGVVKGEYNVQYQLELYQKTSVLYKKIRSAHQQKLIPEVEYLNAESKYQQVFFQLESAQNDLLSAGMLLSQTANLNPDDPMPLDLELKFTKVNPEFSQVLPIALKKNPDLRVKESALNSAKYGVDIYQAKKYPRFDLRGSFGHLGETFKDSEAIEANKHNIDTEKEWFLGVRGSLPLGPNTLEYDQIKHVYGPTVSAFQGSDDYKRRLAFNLFDNLSNITDEKNAYAVWLQAEADFRKAKSDTTIKLRDDFYNLQKSLIQIDSAVARIRYQEKQNGILEYLLGLQETSVENLLEGWIAYAQDKFSFIQAATDYHLAVSGMTVTLGDSNYFGIPT